MLSEDDNSYLTSAQFIQDYDKGLHELWQKYGPHFDPNIGTSNPDDIKAGLEILPEGALYSCLEILREMGCPNPKIIWARRYKDGKITLSFTGICPIHRYEHSNNHFVFQHKDCNSWLLCYHDHTKRSIPMLPLPNMLNKHHEDNHRWQYV